jgi:hypothetical protein
MSKMRTKSTQKPQKTLSTDDPSPARRNPSPASGHRRAADEKAA